MFIQRATSEGSDQPPLSHSLIKATVALMRLLWTLLAPFILNRHTDCYRYLHRSGNSQNKFPISVVHYSQDIVGCSRTVCRMLSLHSASSTSKRRIKSKCRTKPDMSKRMYPNHRMIMALLVLIDWQQKR